MASSAMFIEWCNAVGMVKQDDSGMFYLAYSTNEPAHKHIELNFQTVPTLVQHYRSKQDNSTDKKRNYIPYS